MAWFKFGKQNDEASSLGEAPVETIEALRSRAKRRLVGALVLVLIAVVGFPLLFDTQPRPALVDVPIEIPDKNKIRPLVGPPALPSVAASAARVDDKASLAGKEEIVIAAPAQGEKSNEKAPLAGTNTTQIATKTVAIAAPPSPDKSVAEKTASDKAASDKAAAEKTKADAARAQALLEGKSIPATPAPAAGGERFIVQFGSFADESKAREVRQKVERAGLKTYAQVAETSEGKRHRARVGPFATRAEAEKAAAKIKSLDLPAAILTL